LYIRYFPGQGFFVCTLITVVRYFRRRIIRLILGLRVAIALALQLDLRGEATIAQGVLHGFDQPALAVDLGLESGLAIVVLAIVLDRMTRIGVGGKK